MQSAVSIVLFALVALVACDKAPYPPAGARPAKAFLLPLRQAPSVTSAPYTAPVSQAFSAPQDFNGPIYPYAVENFAEPAPARQEVEPVSTATPKTDKQEVEVGQYYILSPEGKLQKVEYLTAAQPQSEFAQKAEQYNVKSARQQFQGSVSNYQYKDVEPITAPVYSYNNVPGPLVRILRRTEGF